MKKLFFIALLASFASLIVGCEQKTTETAPSAPSTNAPAAK